MTSVEFHVGGSVVKENKVRFAYFSVKAEAKIVKENVQGRRCYNVFVFVENNNLTQDHLANVFKCVIAKIKSELLNKIIALMELTSDGENFLTNSQLKFLA